MKSNVLKEATINAEEQEKGADLAHLVKLHYASERAKLALNIAVNDYKEKYGFSPGSLVNIVDGSEQKPQAERPEF